MAKWNEPVSRGKRVFDDAEFYGSLSRQFQEKKNLSPRQVAALKRLAFRYREQIPGFDEAAAKLGIRPSGRSRRGAAPARGQKGPAQDKEGKE